MPLPALIPVAIGIGNVLHKTYTIGKKAYKIAKPHVGKHVSPVVSDVKRKSVATYKTFKESLLTGKNPLTHGTSSKLIYKKAPKGKMYKGKPQINIHASRKQSMIDTRKRELLATGGRFSKESKRTGAVGLAGSALYLTSGETEATTIKPSSDKDKMTQYLDSKKDLIKTINGLHSVRLVAVSETQTIAISHYDNAQQVADAEETFKQIMIGMKVFFTAPPEIMHGDIFWSVEDH